MYPSSHVYVAIAAQAACGAERRGVSACAGGQREMALGGGGNWGGERTHERREDKPTGSLPRSRALDSSPAARRNPWHPRFVAPHSRALRAEVAPLHPSLARGRTCQELMSRCRYSRLLGTELFDDKRNPGARKTLELFGTSAIIVGPHGAGLSNIAVAPPGTTVVEFIVSGRAINICYMVFATKLAVDYHAVTDPKSGQAAPMTVDVEKVAGIVRAALAVDGRGSG